MTWPHLSSPSFRPATSSVSRGTPFPPVVDTMAMRDISPDELFKRDPPPFGRPMLDYFPLDPEYINLNHGEFI